MGWMNEFQRHTLATDQNSLQGMDGLRFPLLGLFGEVGSLLSALKKKQRDRASYTRYEDSVREEFGDVLWYFSNIAARAGLDLSVLASAENVTGHHRLGRDPAARVWNVRRCAATFHNETPLLQSCVRATADPAR